MLTTAHLPRSLSGLIGFSAKILLTAAAFWFALRGIDWQEFLNIISRQEPFFLLIAVAAIIAQIFLGGVRWHYIVASLSQNGKAAMPLRDAARLYYISVFFSCCLPGSIGGDVVRAWMAKSERMPLSLSVSSIIIDRLLALAAMMMLIIVMLPLVAQALEFNFWPVFLAIAVVLLTSLAVFRRMEKWLAPHNHKHMARWLLMFIHSLRLLVRNPGASFRSLVYAVLAHLFYCVCAYALGQSMGLALSFLHCLMFMPLVLLFTTVPISIGGWGVREASAIWLLGTAGISNAAALALSIQLGVITILISLPGAALWLAFKRKTGEPLT